MRFFSWKRHYITLDFLIDINNAKFLFGLSRGSTIDSLILEGNYILHYNYGPLFRMNFEGTISHIVSNLNVKYFENSHINSSNNFNFLFGGNTNGGIIKNCINNSNIEINAERGGD